MAASRPWTLDDRTGGPLDDILRSVQSLFPDAIVTRMDGIHDADDDNVFWVQHRDIDVQIDTAPGGSPPFTMESDGPGTRLDTNDAAAAEAHLKRLLSAVGET